MTPQNPQIPEGLLKKHQRIEQLVDELAAVRPDALAGLDPCYSGWFTCFNRGEYYEAHDVLEHLWLKTVGDDYAYYKGLIQLAGAFVHLRKQYERPTHHKDGRRLAPASRLFRLALNNLTPYLPLHHRLDLVPVCELAESMMELLENGAYKVNPWSPDALPQIFPQPAL